MAQADKPGMGHNKGPALDPPPPVPETRPAQASDRNNFYKAAAQWLAKSIRSGGYAAGFAAALDALSWLDADRAYIDSYLDPPRSLEELQSAVSPIRRRGYHDHHVVEQTPAENDGFPRSLIDGQENLVRIPAIKHWEITGWFARGNKSFGGLPPREYLRGKSWEERVKVGREALIEHGVLKP